jgi:hypothetical protein
MRLNTQLREAPIRYHDGQKLEVHSIWEKVRGYEGLYKVSQTGKVRSVSRTVKLRDGRTRWLQGRVLKPSLYSGYPGVCLCKRGKQEIVLVHRLVAIAFISNPYHKPEVNHKDGDKTNCNVRNLEWVTQVENERHALRMGLKARGMRIAVCVIPEEDIPSIISRVRGGEVQKRIAVEYGVSPCTINDIWKGRRVCLL